MHLYAVVVFLSFFAVVIVAAEPLQCGGSPGATFAESPLDRGDARWRGACGIVDRRKMLRFFLHLDQLAGGGHSEEE